MKTVDEWLAAFNLEYNNLTSNQAPGLEIYEISLLLTDAQDDVVTALYNGTLGNAFESTEQVTNLLSTLVDQKTVTTTLSTGDAYKTLFAKPSDTADKSLPKSYVFDLSTVTDILLKTFERCTLTGTTCGTTKAIVVPVTQDEVWATVRNPFKGPNERRVLRLSYSTPRTEVTENHYHAIQYVEIISNYAVSDYTVRFIKRPSPIILGNLGTLTIRGESSQKACSLPEELHQLILSEAVKSAKAIWLNQ